MSEIDLKKFYNKQLVVFVIINFIIFYSVLISQKVDIQSISNVVKDFNFESVLFILSSPIIYLIFSRLLDSNQKAILSSWSLKYPLPGYRAFSLYMDNNPRIDKKIILENIGRIPANPIEENQLWYSIYKKHKLVKSVIDGHKDFLFSRDLTAASFIFLIVFSVTLLITINIKNIFIYIIFLMLQYILLARTTRVSGRAFVINVLAEESSTILEEGQ